MIFGAAYYPEQWNSQEWAEDLKIMKDMGLSSVRLAEFAWAVMEPKEGKFDFTLFDSVLELVDKAGMTAILGTPTATFPPWLFEKYPEIIQTSKTGIKRIIGTRRQACFSSPAFLKATERIVTAMAKHYGNVSVVTAWQIDNEPGHEGSDQDYSELSQKSFQKWLKVKYSTLQELNESWGNVFWGVIFDKWEQIPVPSVTYSSNFNPALIQDFYRFQSDELISYINLQASILKKHTKNQKLTVNLYPSPFLPVTDMNLLFEKLDFVSYDNYPVWGNQREPFPHPLVSASLQYSRGLKDKPFTIMEQISGVQGHDTLGYLPPPGQIGLWLVQAVLNGADQIFFFRYRTARFGQEQLCYGILDHGKHLTNKYLELKSTIETIQKMAEDIKEEPFEAKALVLHDIENSRNYKHQPLSDGLKLNPVPFAQVGYDVELATWFAGTNVLNVPTHFHSVNYLKDWNKYRLISLPLYTMYDSEVVEKLNQYVLQGGILVLGYRAGIKAKNHWMDTDPVPGQFRRMAGLEVHQFEAIPPDVSVGIRMGLFPLKGQKFCEILEPKTASPIAYYWDKNKFYSKRPAITEHKWGKGKVYYLGTSLSPGSMVLFYRKILKANHIPFEFLGSSIEKFTRKGKMYNYEVILNHGSKPKWVGWKKIPAYGFLIKKTIKPN